MNSNRIVGLMAVALAGSLTAALGAEAQAAPAASARPAPAAGTAQATDKGAAVYTAQKCALCHSLDGKGQAKGPLDGVGSKLTADEIRQWMVAPVEMSKKAKATRKPPMKAYPNLPKEDLDALVAFLHSKKKT